MKTRKTVSVFSILLIMSVLFLGCLPGGFSGQEDLPTPTPLPDIRGTSQEKILLIADRVTQESDGLLVVSYTETPLHRTASGEIHYGIHYNVFTTKRADLVTLADKERVREFAGEIFQLTTEYILPDSSSFSHVGVQVFDADAWFEGGHKRGSVRIFIAGRADLLAQDPDAAPYQWLVTAKEYPQVIIPFSALQDLINRLREAEQSK